ncbi:hypothetical protein [Streptomyces sp. NPDC102360]|uniref:hypothetical protein n=1 Tax=Streptomyces sp. NPDC102360 TaxID=3366160 RepID=UPI00380FE2C6
MSEDERFTERDFAQLTDAYWLDAPHRPDASYACPLDHTPQGDIMTWLRPWLVGLSAALIAVGGTVAILTG